MSLPTRSRSYCIALALALALAAAASSLHATEPWPQPCKPPCATR